MPFPLRALLMSGLFIGVMAAALFGCAGRLDLRFFWAYLGVPAIAMLAILPRMDRELFKERFRPGPGGKDRYLRFLAMPFFLGQMAVAGLDVGRFHFSDTVPLWLQIGGLVVYTLSFALSGWAVKVNRFFSPVVRIQEERGHRLITDGPYRWIRHPGYLASMCASLCGGLTLGSWWALAPAAAMTVLIVRRTALEDRYLQNNLAGYANYTRSVPYRLIRGLW